MDETLEAVVAYAVVALLIILICVVVALIVGLCVSTISDLCGNKKRVKK